MPRKLSRRDLLKAAQVAGAGGAAGALALFGASGRAQAAVGGTCRLCTMHCGIKALVRAGRIEKIEGDPTADSRGFLCLHGHAVRELVHSPARLTTPLARSGGERRPLSWDDAYRGIAERLRAVAATHGPQAVAIQLGWPFVRNPQYLLFQRFAYAFGTPNLVTAASFCAVAGTMGRALTFGTNAWPDVARARTLLVWGANPTLTAPLFAHQVHSATLNGRRLIVIDPVRTELAAHASEHLMIRPGTDLALALGLMHVILREGWHDQAFLEENAVGLAELAAHVRDFDPEKTAALTGLPPDAIVRTARHFSQDGPSAIWDCLGVEHHETGTQTVRALSMLSALCGFVDVPGGQRLVDRREPGAAGALIPGTVRIPSPEPLPPVPEVEAIGAADHPLFFAFNRQAQSMHFARAILEDRPYPLRALLVFGANPLVTSPGSAELARAFARLELLVVVDPFLSATGRAAHYVLPAASFAECAPVEARTPAPPLVEPQRGSRPDWRILFELARALGLERYFPWSSREEALSAPRRPYPEAAPEALLARWPEGQVARFPTVSGRIELRSSVLERYGHDALPTWRPPSRAPDADYPLWLVTGPRPSVFINSQLREAPSVSSKLARPQAWLHPEVGRSLGLEEGAEILVESPAGSVRIQLHLTPDVHPEALVLPAGFAEANANLLTAASPLDPVSGFPALRSSVCRVRRA